jgi:M6 family metalloprotease-like protein
MKNIKTITLSVMLLCGTTLFAQRSNCAATPDMIQVTQPDGSTADLYMKGNEVFHYYQTADGYTVLQNPSNNGRYEYAVQNEQGFIVPSGVIIGSTFNKTAPAKYLKPSTQQVKQAYQQFMGNTPATVFNKAGSNDVFPSIGRRKLLVVLVQFPDEQTVFSAQSFERLMTEEGYNDNTCAGSFRDYYLDNSNNALDLDITVLGWYTAKRPRIEYGQKDAQGNSNPNYNSNVQELVAQTIDSAEAAGINFADFDNNGDGDMDGLVIFHSGFGAEQGKNGYIWSHRWTLFGNKTRTYDGTTIRNYCINPSKRDFSDGVGTTQVRIGVVSHEFGHVLGLPDLYDTDDHSEGAGEWCIMSGGGWLHKESNPCRMNAWCKTEMNWMTPTTISLNGKYSLTNSTDSNIAYKVMTPVSNEFYLLENRQRKKWDAYLPGKGMAIWHIDLNKAENYRLFGSNDVNTDTSMLGVGIIQADGLRELERNINRGNGGDLYPGTTNNQSFTAASNPRSRLHEKDNLGNPSPSNVTIVNIAQMADSTIVFDFGGIPTASFKPSVVSGCAPLTVSLTNQSVFSAAYSWTLGNGNVSSQTNPVVVYNTPGNYTITLVVFDANNTPVDTITKSIVVNSSPKAGYSFKQTDTSITFANTSTGADFYAWRFGSTSSFAVNPTFKFTGPVVFTLIAYNNNGCSDTLSGNLWNNGLNDPSKAPIALAIYPNPVKESATLSFELQESSNVTVGVYDILGKEVLVEQISTLSAGHQTIQLNTKTISAQGVYFIKLKADHQEGVQRMLKQ